MSYCAKHNTACYKTGLELLINKYFRWGQIAWLPRHHLWTPYKSCTTSDNILNGHSRSTCVLHLVGELLNIWPYHRLVNRSVSLEKTIRCVIPDKTGLLLYCNRVLYINENDAALQVALCIWACKHVDGAWIQKKGPKQTERPGGKSPRLCLPKTQSDTISYSLMAKYRGNTKYLLFMLFKSGGRHCGILAWQFSPSTFWR